MKLYLTFIFSIICFTAFTQSNDTITVSKNYLSGKGHRSTIATISVGFIDYYRASPDYSLPKSFRENNTSGFAPINGKLEYGLAGSMSMAALVYYDNFNYNFDQVYTGNSRTFSRYKTNTLKLFGAGLSFCYYFDKYIHTTHFEPFLCLGVSLNNIHQTAIPQGDSTIEKTTHIASPCIKAGVRYLLTPKRNAGIYFDLGYDRQSIFNIGFSCTLYRAKGKHIRL